MVSLLEQYETETQKTNDYSDELNPLRSGYIQAALNINENEDIFKSHRVQINIQDRSIDQYEKCSGQMAILFRPRTIRLLHIENRTDETLESPEAINRFYLDTTGRHLLVATESQELYYYSRQSKKFKSISRLRGHLVTAVAWNKTSTDKSIESILLGTNKGALFELSINTSNEGILSSNVESYCKQIYNFGKEAGKEAGKDVGKEVVSITGIEILHFKKENNYSAPNIENIYDIVVATHSFLYEFVGNDSNTSVQQAPTMLTSTATSLIANQSNIPIFTSIFSYYESKSSSELANFIQMPRGNGQIQLRSNTRTRKKTLAWMNGGGVLIYEFDPFSLAKFSAANFHNETSKKLILENTFQNLRFPHLKNDDQDEQPMGMCLTEFHVAFFYKAQVRIMCLLNEELVLNQKLDPKSVGGSTVGCWFDSVLADFGSYTSQSIIKYAVNKESRKIWKIYLSKNEFEMAKSFCKDNPANMNLVLTKQAEYLFNNKKYIDSAIYYAQTQNSFEEICLKYLELSDFTALRTYLTHKLNNFDVKNEITQTTVIISYIIEIFLSQLTDLTHEKSFDEYDCLHNEFCKFLDSAKVKNCLRESKDAIYKIFASHGNISDMIYFAEVMKDYAQIIAHYIQEENYRKALEALAKQNNKETFYKYSPLFFELLPKEIVELWMKVGNLLNPVKLLPSLASCSLTEEQITEAMRYLEYCVNKLSSEDTSVHNNLLILYLKHAPNRLLEYVKTRKEQRPVHFDELMIARLCTTTQSGATNAAERAALNEACVYLYTRMGWFEEAVELALTVNVELAREVAQSVRGDDFANQAYMEELKKVLWLRIARHVIEKENDVNKAMQFLQDMTESIAIEDVLPYFPEFVTIDQFKDAIRTSLANYTDRINSLKENIDQAAKSAQLIRRDIQSIKQKSMVVNTNDQCSKCRFRLMSRRFYIFPCSHKFHADCLYVTSMPYLLPSKQKRIDELQKLLQDIQTIPIQSPSVNQTATQQPQSPAQQTASSLVTTMMNQHFSKASSKLAHQPPQTYSNEEIFRLKSELDELLANECPWCGERILKTIDVPFIDPLNYEAVFQSWL